ncbi:MAG: hypothetical protein IPJ08_13345 [Burkholderiales bacterium]|nr:hypothetical protein [Burkholderiales bacterium]
MRPHPLLYLLATRPQWLAEHALAYGGLAGDELALAACHWQRQAWLQAVAAGCAVATLGVAGVALLLWAVTPAALQPSPWLWWLALGLPAGPGLLCLALARNGQRQRSFAGLREQLQADLTLLRETHAP